MIVLRLVNIFKQVGCLKVRLLLAIALLFQINTFAQNGGELLFKSYCVACHTIGNGRLVGPDLIGVNEKYEEDWLLSFIQSSQTMVTAGDERAAKVFNEYMIPMPDQPLSNDQVKDVLSYIGNQSIPEVVENPVAKNTELNNEDLSIRKTTSFSYNNLSYIDVVLLSVMGIELITVLILINLVIVLIKSVKPVNK
jgi:mono/diheme cytochrome c family protein